VFWAGRALVGDRAAAGGAVLMAVSPMAIAHSQDARPIIFVVLFAALSYGCLVRAVRDGATRMWALYVLATAAVFYSNLASGAWLLVAQAVHALAVEPRARAPWLRAVAALVVLTVLERRTRDPLYWLSSPSVGDLGEALRTVAGGTAALAVVLAAL